MAPFFTIATDSVVVASVGGELERATMEKGSGRKEAEKACAGGRMGVNRFHSPLSPKKVKPFLTSPPFISQLKRRHASECTHGGIPCSVALPTTPLRMKIEETQLILPRLLHGTCGQTAVSCWRVMFPIMGPITSRPINVRALLRCWQRHLSTLEHHP
jgi:hypothetical protein